MPVVREIVKTSCFECHKDLRAMAKIDRQINKKDKIMQYLEIYGGERREFPNKAKANYCNDCIEKIEREKIKPEVFCISNELKDWGIGKLLEVSGDIAKVDYFIAPTIDNKVFEVKITSLKKVKIFRNRRIYWKDTDTALWRVGRLIREDGVKFTVHFPNQDCRDLTFYEIFVRCSKPIDDPTTYLAGYVTETPFLSETRTKFISSMIAQRRVSQGLSGLLSSSIELEPHQWRVVRQVLTDPVQRYLLADEVGLGKTIEAGIIIRQYVLDYPESHSVAIIVPTTLKQQWHSELSEKFHLSNHLTKETIKIITDEELVTIRFDQKNYGMIVIDEAHRIVQGVSIKKETEIYRLIKEVAHKVDRLLLLSATPALGNEMTFLAMLHLLDPDIYSLKDLDSFKERVSNRQTLARLVASLIPDNLYFLNDSMNELEALFPEDKLLKEHTNSLRTIIENEPNNDDPEYCQTLLTLKSHVSETYKLHRRILRNRRVNVKDITPTRIGLTKLPYESEYIGILIKSIEKWRSYVSNQFYNREQTDEYNRFVELHWKYLECLMSDINALINTLQERLDDNRDIPLLNDEYDYLQEILDSAKLFNAEQGRMIALRKYLGKIKGYGKVVIFCSNPEMADIIFNKIQETFSTHTVIRHSLDNNDWEEFNTKPRVRYLICDYRAEEGLNLHGGDRILLHYDIPLSPNRLEQRTGRLDRYGVGDILTVVPICENNDYETRWLSCLDSGFNIFQTSIASLQYLIDEKIQELKYKVMNSGFEALDILLNQLQGENGIVKTELRKINDQDNLDALSNEDDDQFTKLEEYDFQWETIQNDIDSWVAKRLCFVKIPHEVEEPPPPDFIFRYKLDLERTLMPIDDFSNHCEGCINNQYMTYPYTFNRITSYRRKLRLLRLGDDFLRGIMQIADLDDTGKSFAMWRYIKDWDKPIELFYRFDFIVETELSKAKEILKHHKHTTEQSLKRLGDLFFPPTTHTVWIDEEYEVVKDENTLNILNSSYNKKHDKNINTVIWDWLLKKFTDIYYWRDWKERCFKARDKAKQLLLENEEFTKFKKECLRKADEIRKRNLSQLKSRIYGLKGLEYDIESERLKIDESLYENLFDGIREPLVRCDSAGIIFVSRHNISGVF